MKELFALLTLTTNKATDWNAFSSRNENPNSGSETPQRPSKDQTRVPQTRSTSVQDHNLTTLGVGDGLVAVGISAQQQLFLSILPSSLISNIPEPLLQ